MTHDICRNSVANYMLIRFSISGFELQSIVSNFSHLFMPPSLHRWTGLWPWKRREYRHATGKCPTNPKRASGAMTATRSFPNACMTKALHSVPPRLLDTCPWATCRPSATLDTCSPRPPRYTHHLGTHITLTWWRPWAERVTRGVSTELLQEPEMVSWGNSLKDNVYNVTDMQFVCLHLDCLLIDYANGMLEKSCMEGEKDLFTSYL